VKRVDVSLPQFLFVVGTRAALGAGLGLLASLKLRRCYQKQLGIALLAFGALTTIPAARLVFARKLEEKAAA
jgi:NhaP-type Na+/H+ or K+/H+ antiporter